MKETPPNRVLTGRSKLEKSHPVEDWEKNAERDFVNASASASSSALSSKIMANQRVVAGGTVMHDTILETSFRLFVEDKFR